MKKLLFYILSLGLGVPSFPSQQINLIWQTSREGSWEEDWIMELLSDVNVTVIDDNKFEQYRDNSIIVLNNVNLDYFHNLKNLNYKFGVIHLSDETYGYPTTFYADAQFVLRNYWHSKFSQQSHVITFPLGYKRRFWNNCSCIPQPCSLRKYMWSFAGQIEGKPTRKNMALSMKKIPNYFIHEIFGWADQKSLAVAPYRDLMLDSVFIPCPSGWVNPDSFRLYEALECGCIPIVEVSNLNYFKTFLGDHPFLEISSWNQAPSLINNLTQNPINLRQKQLDCQQWWSHYKSQLKQQCTTVVLQALG